MAYFDFGICSAKLAVGKSFCTAFVEANKAKTDVIKESHVDPEKALLEGLVDMARKLF